MSCNKQVIGILRLDGSGDLLVCERGRRHLALRVDASQVGNAMLLISLWYTVVVLFRCSTFCHFI